MRIAVIGSGIAGLGAAWALAAEHEVTLFERAAAPGMDAHSIDVAGARIDVPLRVFYEGYYPTLRALYDRIGVHVQQVDYSGSFSRLGGEPFFRYHALRFAGRAVPYVRGRRGLNRRALRIVRDLLAFLAIARHDLASGRAAQGTLAGYLRGRGFSGDFIDGFMIPTFAGICTCTTATAADYPAAVIIDYMTRGLFFRGVRRSGRGTRDVVQRLLAGVHEVRNATAIEAVQVDARDDGGDGAVQLRDSEGHEARFDHAVIATQSNQAMRLLAAPSQRERDILGGFTYERSRVVVHGDGRLAPPARAQWAPVNFVISEAHDKPMATIWLNAVQAELAEHPRDVFQTWNPIVEPDPELVHSSAWFERPIVTATSAARIDALVALQATPGRRIHFCGSYADHGIPLLESALTSALRIARQLGADAQL